ncbi:hypothetical protein ASC66_04205 [Leifsonia sp. Root4]|nr:hypothetical protein ASC66_04205 [Leifsonia sp. Root4]
MHNVDSIEECCGKRENLFLSWLIGAAVLAHVTAIDVLAEQSSLCSPVYIYVAYIEKLHNALVVKGAKPTDLAFDQMCPVHLRTKELDSESARSP